MATQEDLEQYQFQSALQKEGTSAQQSAYAPQLYEQVQQQQAILVDQTNPKKIIKEITLRLRGMTENPDGTLTSIADPKLNKKGIDAVWFILDSHINQNVILSHLEAFEIRNIMESLQNDIVDSLSLNCKEYGIKNKTDLDDINNSILINIYLALKRAEGQNEKNWLSKISVENISGGYKLPSVKKEGFWNKFKL